MTQTTSNGADRSKNYAGLVNAAPPRGLLAGTGFTIRALWAHRELLVLLIRRELKAKYKDSALGFVWTLVRPLAQLLIYYVAIGKFLQAERSVPQFAIFVFTGLTIWTLYSEIISLSTTSIVANSGLVKKVYIPRELFPLASVGGALFNFAVQFAILIVATFALGQAPLTPDFALVPLAFLTIVVFAATIGLLLSALNVFLRDFQHLVEVLLLVLFWASPIVYSYDMVHKILQGNWIEQIYLWNPVTMVVIAFQKGIWIAGTKEGITFPPDIPLRLLVMLVISAALFWFAQRVFARLEGNFAQEL